MAKSLKVAYGLWFLFGWLGVHHFYLRRDRHAFFTFATLGGVFGIGWFRDLFNLPRYVDDVNETPEFMQTIGDQIRHSKSPKVGTCRWAASALLGYVFGMLFYTVFWSDDLNTRYLNILAFLAHTLLAYGVYIPSNEGRLKVSFSYCMLGSMVCLPLTLLYGPDTLYNTALAASFTAGWNTEWKRQPDTGGLCGRLFWLSVIGCLYMGAISAGIYYNATITTKEGETVPLREAVHNFFTSPAWKETKETLNQFYTYYSHHGWKALWNEIVDALDPQGEANAYKVLGLDSSASQKDIKRNYKKLAMQWHPDKVKDPSQKREAEIKFMEIQQSYEILSRIKQERSEKSKKS